MAKGLYIRGETSEGRDEELLLMAHAALLYSNEWLMHVLSSLHQIKTETDEAQREEHVKAFLDAEVTWYPWTREIVQAAQSTLAYRVNAIFDGIDGLPGEDDEEADTDVDPDGDDNGWEEDA